jgi:hypothetical protein
MEPVGGVVLAHADRANNSISNDGIAPGKSIVETIPRLEDGFGSHSYPSRAIKLCQD